MGLFRKNPDPITDRSRALNAKISALESKIKRLTEEADPHPSRARAKTGGRGGPGESPKENGAERTGDPIFEPIDQKTLKTPVEAAAPPLPASDLGVRKSDLWSLLDRWRRQFQSPPAANPKLVNYLAAGSIQGLRPLRYEKRVARNRFVALAGLLLLVFLGIYLALQHRH